MFRIVLLCVVILSAAASAFAEGTLPKDADTSAAFLKELAQGHGLYRKMDYEGANKVYESIRDKAPGEPLIYYFIGCAHMKLSKYEEASMAFKTMITLAGDKKFALHAKALFMLSILEEMKGDLDSASKSWAEYKAYVQKKPGSKGFVGTADARIEAIEKKRALDEQYKAVKQRIETSK